ncbi:syntaxin 7 [Babesia ovis]|uniref:Syntaxin 7 n=1 Tax=Babesia ovis TaxID=5869 RepID=A0A9W5TCQ8_BABOV|nr:syntaxin 7 [Babesia ovis]
MVRKHGISTMAAMASRNTKAANRAKASMKRFRTAVIKILKEAESADSSNMDVGSVTAAIKRVRTDATLVLTDLHEYYEEIAAMRESSELYDSLLRELKDYLDKLDALQTRLIKDNPTYSTATTPSESTIEPSTVQHQALLQEMSPPSFVSPIDSSIINERSQQIHHLRSSVYDIHDIYVQIGDITEYQGDQLDNIEMNMERALGDTMETNLELHTSAERERTSWKHKFLICILIFCLVVIIIKYRSL